MEMKEWIQENFTPAVMVISSPEVEALCHESNGFNIVDMLRPFGYLQQLSVPVRTVGEQAYRIRELRVRFYQADMMFKPSPEAADEYLKGVVNAAGKESSSAAVPDVLTALRKGTVGELAESTPSWRHYRQEFLRTMAFGEWETYDHPVACLLVLHANAENPVEAFGRMFHSAPRPPLMKTGKMEHRLVMHHLLVHADNAAAEGGYAKSEEKLKAARAALGQAAVHLIRINSHKGDPAAVVGYERKWRLPLPGCLPSGGAGEPPSRPDVPAAGLGACLTQANLEDIKRFVEDFAVRALLPAMEARVRALNHQVKSTRKGLTNQLKTLLWRKPLTGTAVSIQGRDSPLSGSVHGGSVHGGAANGGLTAYSGASIESQMRSLADLAFLMQDYEMALSTLRLLCSDLKTDKKWRQYAGAQETMALAMIMTNAPSSEVVATFKEAYGRYSHLTNSGTNKELVRYTTRAMMLAADYAKQQGNFTEANYALMKAHYQEENLRSGLLLEQGALCLLRERPPKLRKFAFHMTLAGLRFNACDQRALGARAYRTVLPVYEGHRWYFIEEHLHDVLGKLDLETGRHDAALQHFAAIIACPNSPAYWQAFYLKQFLDCVTATEGSQGKAPVLELVLPELDAGKIRIHSDDQVCHANAEARALPEEDWRLLEAPLLAGSDIQVASWLDGGSSSKIAGLALNTAVVGEPLEVLVSVSNPLALELSVSRMRLTFDAEPSSASEAAASGATAGAGEAEPAEALPGNFAEAEESAVTLKPQESAWVALRLRPLQPGLLTLTGVEWLLNDTAPGRKQFALRPPPTHRRTASKAPSKAEGQSQCLAFTVLPALPKLEASVEDLPDCLLEGELRKCMLVLRNTGASALHGIRMVTSGPDVYVSPDNADLSSPSADSVMPGRQQPASTSGAVEHLQEPGIPLRRGMRRCAWPASRALQPQDEIRWPLWVHPRDRGPFGFHLAFYYEPQAPVDGMKHRLLRLRHVVDVVPALSAVAEVAASRTDLDSFILRLTLQGLQPVTLRHISSMHSGWKLSALQNRSDAQSNPAQPSAILAADLAASISAPSSTYCRLHPPSQTSRNSASADERAMQSRCLAFFHTEHMRALQPEPELEQMSQRPSKVSLDKAAAEAQPLPLAGAAPSTDKDVGASGGADLALIWTLEAPEGQPSRAGATHFYDVLEKEKVALRAVLRGKKQLQHDFQRSGSCSVPLTLALRNCSDAAVSVCVEAGAPSSVQPAAEAMWRSMPAVPPAGSAGPQSQAGGAAPEPAASRAALGSPAGPAYMWTGSTRSLLPALRPGQSAQVPLQVSVHVPGAFEISDYVIRWAAHDKQFQQPGPAFLLMVEDDTSDRLQDV